MISTSTQDDYSSKVLIKRTRQLIGKKSKLHGKEEIQYILLFYQLYNLVSYRLSLLYILDESVMITS